MNIAYSNTAEFSFFSDANAQLNTMIEHLGSLLSLEQDHGEIEHYIHHEGHELLRRLFQAHLDVRASEEVRQDKVINAQGINLTHFRAKTTRTLTTLFGDVIITRKSYSKPSAKSVFPLDSALNISQDQFSDGVRLRLAEQVNHCAYDHAIDQLSTTTGAAIGKRQSLKLVQDIAQDFEDYYLQNRYIEPEKTNALLVLTFDGKGIVMRPDSLRECTKKRAKKTNKLTSRLSAGEKRDRKRMAQVASVYTVLPHCRSAESIMHKEQEDNVHVLRPPVQNKRVWASVERDPERVISEAFEEALQRDPEQRRQWIVLIDGQPAQRKIIEKVAKNLNVKVTIVMDFIHVLEYLWKAAWCFFSKGDKAVENWVAQRALKILKGGCNQVAKGIRQSATKQKLDKREAVDKCASYLLKNKKWLQYDHALASGFPIASGIIEGACRHLINDRLDITGARWSLDGAEAILKLRSLKSSGDFDSYWHFHKQQSKKRHYTFRCS